MQRFEGQVQLVLYPFVLNPTSKVATQAALCAGEQGKFWEFHQMLYARQETWRTLSDPLERLLDYAQSLGVDLAALKSCVRDGRMRSIIEADKAYGESLNVQSTPTVFISTQRVVGAQPEGDFVRMIRQELERAKR